MKKRGPLKHKPAKVGYKDAASARETVSKLNNMPRAEARILANTLSNRAKFHQNQTEDMREAKSIIDDWRKEQRDKDENMDKQESESLEKSCPRCGKTSANSSNPSGRCRACLDKLARNKKTPGHWQRAQTKADDALRRQKGENGTAHKKSSGLGSRDSIVKQTQRAEKKTGQKLSPDRKDNGKGYKSSNVRMVPERLNRGRHKVDGKKLRAWQQRLNKADIGLEEFYTYLLAKSYQTADTATQQLVEDMHPNDLYNFINNNDVPLEKSVDEQLDDLFEIEGLVKMNYEDMDLDEKTKAKIEAKMHWTRQPQQEKGVHEWVHPQHGSIKLTVTPAPYGGNTYHVAHHQLGGQTNVGSFTDPRLVVPATKKYMKDVDMMPKPKKPSI